VAVQSALIQLFSHGFASLAIGSRKVSGEAQEKMGYSGGVCFAAGVFHIGGEAMPDFLLATLLLFLWEF